MKEEKFDYRPFCKIEEPVMSLRDWFAGQALASGLCPHNVYELAAVASWCTRMGDAMMVARKEAGE